MKYVQIKQSFSSDSLGNMVDVNVLCVKERSKLRVLPYMNFENIINSKHFEGLNLRLLE